VIRVSFDPDALPPAQKAWWDAWLKRADEATVQAIEAWEAWKLAAPPGARFQHKFDESIWGDLKDWLLANVFHDKCAYCETPVARSVFHADHYRPKGRVRYRVENKKSLMTGTCTDAAGQLIEHPGYFWLAYHWRNLLPVCALCNSGKGKGDQFPAHSYVLVRQVGKPEIDQLRRKPFPSKAWQSFFYLDPEDLDSLEDPGLLHPYAPKPEDDPERHLVFGEAGMVAARDGSPKGKNSILVYHLDEEKLRAARQAAQDTARMQLYAAMAAQPPGTPLKEIRENARQQIAALYADPRKPYSAAVRDFLQLLS
jgi:hypothetical protein